MVKEDEAKNPVKGKSTLNLRQFRFERKSDSQNKSTTSNIPEDERSQSPVLGSRKALLGAKNNLKEEAVTKTPQKHLLEEPEDNGSPFFKTVLAKRRRISSESDAEEEKAGTSSANDVADDLEAKFSKLKQVFPNKDDMELQDCLLRHNWDVDAATDSLSDAQKGSKSKGRVFRIASPPLLKKNEGPGHKHQRKSKIEAEEAEFDDDFKVDRKVYESDDSDDEYPRSDDPALAKDRKMVLEFLSSAQPEELLAIPGCSKKKAEILVSLRPFPNWDVLVSKVKNAKSVSTDMLNGTREVLKMREVTEKLLKSCQRIGSRLASAVEHLTTGDNEGLEQPKCIPSSLKLAGYQLIGLHWLSLMHREGLNGILGDEMGLGKTIQTLAFLAYLKDQGNTQPHLIVAPSSIIDNWLRELSVWCPFFNVLCYAGSQEERKQIRIAYVNNALEHFDIVVSSYAMVASSPEDRALFKRIPFKYVVFDEAHMLKNMKSQRYENLMKIKAERRLLLTGTPLQNNLIELMSLLVFVMPKLFEGKKELLKRVFAMFPRTGEDESRPKYEKDRIGQAKQILEPFFLRRLKETVLRDLPTKHDQTLFVAMTPHQRKLYDTLIKKFSSRKSDLDLGIGDAKTEKGTAMIMQLRKLANHPLLVRDRYTETQIVKIAKIMKKDPDYAKEELKHLQEDLSFMSDFEIHQTCLKKKSLQEFALPAESVAESGKCHKLDELLSKAQEEGHRILLFSQFVIVLDILEEYLKLRGHRYLRLDGNTPVSERQDLIDEYENNPEILVFMLSTRAGGMGINLTSANQVILHDIDFNPYNDKQAEDRCHRLGQKKEVEIMRLISEGSIEENMYAQAQEKLQLEANVTGRDHTNGETEPKDVLNLLQQALKLKTSS